MVGLVTLIILICSLVGMGVMVFRKMPLLLESSAVAPFQFNWKELLIKIKNFLPFRDFSFEIFLQKILSKIRILTLKTDSQTSSWLQKLREKARKKKFGENDKYWEEIKKSTKE